MGDKLLFSLGAKIQRFKILNAHIINRRLIRETKQMPKAWKVGKGNHQNQYVNTVQSLASQLAQVLNMGIDNEFVMTCLVKSKSLLMNG